MFNGVGHPVKQWNIVDQDGAVYLPMGIAIDSDGNVYISGMQMSGTTPVSRILKFNQNGVPFPGGKSGVLLTP